MVIGIIALLIGILLPALGAARDAARRALCFSNQKQVVLGATGFAFEHGEMYEVPPNNAAGSDPFPPNVMKIPAGGYGGHFTGDWDLPAAMAPYTDEGGIWGCPVMGAPSVDDPVNNRSPASYGNYAYYPGNLNPLFDRSAPDDHPRHMDETDQPSTMPLISDYSTFNYATSNYGFSHGKGPLHSNPPSNNPSNARFFSPNQSDMTNAVIGFFDGSARSFTPGELVDVGSSHPGSTTHLFLVMP